MLLNLCAYNLKYFTIIISQREETVKRYNIKLSNFIWRTSFGENLSQFWTILFL